MLCDAYWDEIELQFETVAQTEPSVGATWDDFPHYPAPMFRQTDSVALRKFRTAVLENDVLRVDIVPALGGRILGIYDKPAKTAIIPIPRRLELVSSGAVLDIELGVWWSVGFDRNPYGLDEVDCQVIPQETETAPASVVLFGLNPTCRTSWHTAITLHPDSRRVLLAIAAFNRDLSTRPASTNVRINLGKGGQASRFPICVTNRANAASICVQTEPGELADIAEDASTLVLRRFAAGEVLAPRQSDKLELSLLPIAGLSKVDGAGNGCALSILENRIECISDSARSAKIVLRSRGETLETPIQLEAGTVASISTEDTGQVERAAIVEGGTVLADTAHQGEMYRSCPVQRKRFDGHSLLWASDWALVRGVAREMQYKHISLVLQASLLAASCDLAQASETLDTALAFNAEDPLTWWLKAALLRIAGLADDDMPEMPNAHFLAPLEPVLRAEAFLSQAHQSKEPSPIVKPLRPECMLEVANLLLESGLDSEAARWLDECLRHHDLPMFRYLLAWMLLTRSKMRAEAAMHVSAAANKGLSAPYPSRSLDFRAVQELALEFPQDSRLAEWGQIASAFYQPKS